MDEDKPSTDSNDAAKQVDCGNNDQPSDGKALPEESTSSTADDKEAAAKDDTVATGDELERESKRAKVEEK